MSNEKTVTLGVSGSVAIYKACDIANYLTREGMNVDVLMTECAERMIDPSVFECITQRPVYTDIFQRGKGRKPLHIELGDRSDVFVIAPATAQIIAEVANGMADNIVTCTLRATGRRVEKYIAPAMNPNMYSDPMVQQNIEQLNNSSYTVLEPKQGRSACGDLGKGPMMSVDDILDHVIDSEEDHE